MAVYVPSTIGQIRDRLGSMVLCMPAMKLPNTDLGMDGAYEQLEHSLGIVQKNLGEERYRRLIDMARISKQNLVDGHLKEGLFLLQDMKKALLKRGNQSGDTPNPGTQ